MSYIWSLASITAGAVAWMLLLGQDVRTFAGVLGALLVVCIAVSLSAGLMGLRRGVGSKILSTNWHPAWRGSCPCCLDPRKCALSEFTCGRAT